MAVDDQELAAHHALLAASMEREMERRAAAARRPGQGLTLDSQVRPGQQGLYFGEGFKPPAHVAPVAPPGDPLVGGCWPLARRWWCSGAGGRPSRSW